MGPGEAITGVTAIIVVFGSFFGGIAYIVHRVLSHRREIKLAEIEAQVRMRGANTPPVTDELLRAVAQELHTQRQMLELLSRRVAALDGHPVPNVGAPTNLAEPIPYPEHEALRTPRPGLQA